MSLIIGLLISTGLGTLLGHLWKRRLWLGAVLGLLGPLGLLIICFLPRRIVEGKLIDKIAPGEWWYTTTDREPVGPVSVEQLAEGIKSGRVTSRALVWNQSMSQWIEAGSAPEWIALFRFNNRRAYQTSLTGALFFWGGLGIALVSLLYYQENVRLAVAGEAAVAEIIAIRPVAMKAHAVSYRVVGETEVREDWTGMVTRLKTGEQVRIWRLKNNHSVSRLSKSLLSVHLVLVLFGGGLVLWGLRRENANG